MINRLLNQLFERSAVFGGLMREAKETGEIVKSCFDFLRRNKEERGVDFVLYLTFLLEYAGGVNWEEREKEMGRLME